MVSASKFLNADDFAVPSHCTSAEAATKRALAAAENLSADLVEVVNSGPSKVGLTFGLWTRATSWTVRNELYEMCLQAFAQQQRIGTEAEKVLGLTKQLSQQNAEWVALINSADQSLRVLGDFETFFEVLQQDLSKLTSSLQNLAQPQPAASVAATATPTP